MNWPGLIKSQTAAMAAAAALVGLACPCAGESSLADLSIEDLMNMKVTSVSRKAEKACNAAAAVYVITSEDIRRSGANSIPELLRLAPGVEVDRIDGSRWAITSRGFIDRFGNKLLVLVDGRSVYTPLFSGVFWDAHQLLLDDIDRIEVIRGPGATVWGANAVNGVINIITKRAIDTEGTMLQASADTIIPQSGSVRFGGSLGHGGHFRVYGRGFDQSALEPAGSMPAYDSCTQRFGGFRADWELPKGQSLLVEAQSYSGHEQEGQITPMGIVDDDASHSGTNALLRWGSASGKSDLSAQLYIDHTARFVRILYSEVRDTTDFDFQHSLQLSSSNQLTWGLGYRVSSDSTKGSPYASWDPASRTEKLAGLFLQDEVTIRPEVRLTFGSKFERNDYTGTEVQPSARLLWTPDSRRTGWLAISRAVRTPCRTEADGRILFGVTTVPVPGVGNVPAPVYLTGNQVYKSESMTAYEAGYRVTPSSRVSIDTALFYNVYDDLRGFTHVGVQGLFPNLWYEITPANAMRARTCGGEISVNYTASSNWRLSASYSRLNMDMRPDTSVAGDEMTLGYPSTSPRNQFRVRSYMDLPNNMEFDLLGYYVGRYDSPHVPFRTPNVPRYFRLDLRLGWRPSAITQVSLGVQNLLQSSHIEFGTTRGEVPTEVPRSVYANVTYQL